MSDKTKVCSKCERSLSVCCFRRRGERDGRNGRYRSWCRECESARRSSEQGRALMRNRCARYRLTDKGRSKDKRQATKYRASGAAGIAERRRYAENPWQALAKAKVNNAIADHRWTRAGDHACESADASCRGQHEWHHDSYRIEDWLRVRCLCKHHHTEWHKHNVALPYAGGYPGLSANGAPTDAVVSDAEVTHG